MKLKVSLPRLKRCAVEPLHTMTVMVTNTNAETWAMFGIVVSCIELPHPWSFIHHLSKLSLPITLVYEANMCLA